MPWAIYNNRLMWTIDGTQRGEFIGGTNNARSDYAWWKNIVVVSAPRNDLIHANGGNDTVNAGGGDDVVFGGTGNDLIYGGQGDDELHGGNDNDTLIGGSGADFLDGDKGNDWASYAASQAGVEVNLTSGQGRFGDAEGDRLKAIENIEGSRFNDTLTGDENSNFLIGGDGEDTLTGGGGHDTFQGGAGDDQIDGGDGYDRVSYADMPDQSDPRAGMTIDLSRQFAESNRYSTERQFDSLSSIENATGSSGADHITGSSVHNSLDGEDGEDDLFGLAGNDVLDGGQGSDRLNGGTGSDILTGGTGADTFIFDHDTGKSPYVVSWVNGKPVFSLREGEQDIITDFEAGRDNINISQSALENWDDLLDNVTQDDFDLVIHTNSLDTIRLEDVNINELDESDFIF